MIRIAWAVAALLPLAVVGALRARPGADVAWENHPAHFWLVLLAALAAVAVGSDVVRSARRRRDARLLLLGLASIAAAGFLGLHALATPGVLLGPNAGFELATPVGLVVAGLLAAASAVEYRVDVSVRLVRAGWAALGVLLAGMAAWAAVSLAEAPPLDEPLGAEQLDGWQVALAAVGVLAYAAAALGYLRLWRRRGARFVLAVTLAYALLAEAMVVTALATNWRLTWWEWHALMLGAFAVVWLTSRLEWHEERFSALYLDDTLAGAKEVSIVFADLQRYSTFAERHRPAEVSEMLNAYFEAIVPRMRELGGEVHQLIGDEVMVVFNKDGDCPDDHAERAALAALELQRIAARVAAGHDDWPRFRAGVNSGEVVAGVVGGERGHRKHGVVGDTVNLAARLEGQAPVGEVVVGAGTAERLPDGTVLERLPQLRVKGKEEPVEAYVLRGLADGGGETR